MTLLLLPFFAGCIDQNVKAIHLDAIAVVLGDFDDMSAPLTALDVATEEYDGFIVQATYEPDDQRTQRGEMALSVETLLNGTDDNGNLDLFGYGAAFVNSGTRGLGVGQYNNALLPDDEILKDPDAVANVCEFVQRGGTLVVSDWAYDLVEACWPDAIEFYGDDATTDAAQVGRANADVLADVHDDKITETLGVSTVSLNYNYSVWSVITDVGADTEVLLTGSVEYQPSADELFDTLEDAPLMVRFSPNGRGTVIYTTFHWAAQTPAVSQGLMIATVEGLKLGSASEEADSGQ